MTLRNICGTLWVPDAEQVSLGGVADANADALTLASEKLEDTFKKNTSFGEDEEEQEADKEE